METWFICVFECTIVNLAKYSQFTNAAWEWVIKKKNKRERKKIKSKLHLSLGYPNSYW